MVILGRWKNRAITISVKTNCLTVSLPAEKGVNVFSYDLEGRLWTANLDGKAHRRALDGRMLVKWRPEGKARRRKWLSQEEALKVEARARQRLTALWEAIRSGEAHLNRALPALGRISFERAVGFDETRSREDAARFFQVYKPVGILPPDQYMAVVLQLTEGCSFNTCTFCNFYRDRPFRIKKPQEFREHARSVKAFLGEGLSLRRTIFLGDANALVVPMSKLVPLIEIVHQEFDVVSLGGIFAFLDGFSGEKKTAKDYARLRALGLQRVYIGMESGHDPLLRFLKKPGEIADVIAAVNAMKAGGLAVGVIVLLGAGGHTFAEGHVRDTIRAINAMHLDMDDLIYYSELIEHEGLEYTRDAFQAHLRPLTHEERVAQGETITQGLKFSLKGGTPHISRYDIREFVY